MDTVTTVPQQLVTFAEFDRIAEQHEGKIELVNGEIVYPDKSKATNYHTFISQNIIEAFRRQWLKLGYVLYAETMGLRYKFDAESSEFFPDLMVGPQRDTTERHSMILDPLAVIEILSIGTEKYDRTEKLPRYQQIPSLREIVLIRQDVAFVEQYLRTERNHWEIRTFSKPTDSISILAATATLESIYDQTNLWPSQVKG